MMRHSWAYQAHSSNYLLKAHSAVSKLDSPNDYHEENCPILAQKRLPTDGSTEGTSDGQAFIEVRERVYMSMKADNLYKKTVSRHTDRPTDRQPICDL